MSIKKYKTAEFRHYFSIQKFFITIQQYSPTFFMRFKTTILKDYSKQTIIKIKYPLTKRPKINIEMQA